MNSDWVNNPKPAKFPDEADFPPEGRRRFTVQRLVILIDGLGHTELIAVGPHGWIGGKLDITRDSLPGSACLRQMFVVEKWRRRGIGAQLLEAAVDVAREWGVERLVLTVQSDNMPARAFWNNLGFRSFPYDAGDGAIAMQLPL